MGVSWGGELHGSMPLACPCFRCGDGGTDCFKSGPLWYEKKGPRVWRRLGMSLLASTIDVMLSRANITTVDAFAELLLSAPTFIANFIRSEAAGQQLQRLQVCTQLRSVR